MFSNLTKVAALAVPACVAGYCYTGLGVSLPNDFLQCEGGQIPGWLMVFILVSLALQDLVGMGRYAAWLAFGSILLGAGLWFAC